jgi:hypothetical protein
VHAASPHPTANSHCLDFCLPAGCLILTPVGC